MIRVLFADKVSLPHRKVMFSEVQISRSAKDKSAAYKLWHWLPLNIIGHFSVQISHESPCGKQADSALKSTWISSLNKALGFGHTTDFGRGFCVQLRLFSAIYSYKGKFRLSVLTTVARFPKIGHVHFWHSFHVKTTSKTTMAAMGLIRAVKQQQKNTARFNRVEPLAIRWEIFRSGARAVCT